MKFSISTVFFVLLIGLSLDLNSSDIKSESPTDLGSTVVSRYAGEAYDIGEDTDVFWSNAFFGARNAPNGDTTTAVIPVGEKTRFLLAVDYGFNIPCNATITSLALEVTRRNGLTGDIVDSEVRLRFADYTMSSGNEASSTVWLESASTFETVTYTSPNWGETLTPDMINNEMFGVVISTSNADVVDDGKPEIDAINMIVCYDLAGSSYTAIDVDVVMQPDICNQNNGSLTFSPRNGSGTYEYSIDGGSSWSQNPVFTGLDGGDYDVYVRNDDGTCQTKEYFYNVGSQAGLVQPGDAIIACRPISGSPVTLVIESIQLFGDLEAAGYDGQDVSCFIEPIQTTFTDIDLCGPVFSVALDEENNIYTGVTSLYGYEAMQSPVITSIDGQTGAVTKLATLPGDVGVAAVDYHSDCDQLFVAHLEDGKIYRLDASTGSTLSIYDPFALDDGAAGYPELGERILAVTFNNTDGKLYYSVWANDRVDNGVRNSIRSIDIDPNTCDFLPATDALQLDLPWLSEACGNILNNYSMPVSDIEFNTAGTTMLLSEIGFDSNSQATSSHRARLLEYDGSSENWTLDTGGNSNNCKYGIGYNIGANSRGGNDFAYYGMNAQGCTEGNESYIVSTGDALNGISCYREGCYYGLQYVDATNGGNQYTSIHLDMDRDPGSQAKSVYGDVDVVKGCSETTVQCSLIATYPLCNGSASGSLEVVGTGGSGNYEYSIDNGATYVLTSLFSGLTSGNYAIVIRDVDMPICASTCSENLIDPVFPCHNITTSRTN